MSYIIFFISSFLFIFLFYKLFVIRKENALNRMKNSKDVLLVCKIGNVNIENIDFKRFVKLLAATNAFIISLTCTIVILICNMISNFYIWIIVSALIGLVLLIPMIFISYKQLGKIINKGR